ncbi:MAG: hypothetical protein BRD55_04760 [Bacteroidetes bacterium SW_9_63_38]|nr:MAG: hypothetical protein BRD55_04760 [Bacteroidetes bacterium SW_9_63_38]
MPSFSVGTRSLRAEETLLGIFSPSSLRIQSHVEGLKATPFTETMGAPSRSRRATGKMIHRVTECASAL